MNKLYFFLILAYCDATNGLPTKSWTMNLDEASASPVRDCPTQFTVQVSVSARQTRIFMAQQGKNKQRIQPIYDQKTKKNYNNTYKLFISLNGKNIIIVSLNF